MCITHTIHFQPISVFLMFLSLLVRFLGTESRLVELVPHSLRCFVICNSTFMYMLYLLLYINNYFLPSVLFGSYSPVILLIYLILWIARITWVLWYCVSCNLVQLVYFFCLTSQDYLTLLITLIILITLLISINDIFCCINHGLRKLMINIIEIILS